MSSPLLMTEPSGDVINEETDALYEVAYGQRIETAPMSTYASVVAAALFFQLQSYLAGQAIGRAVIETLCVLDAHANHRRRPDVAFISADAWPLDRELPEIGDWEVIPTLAVEIIHPSNFALDVLNKLHEYFRYGVSAVWHVYPNSREIYCYSSPVNVIILDETQMLTCEDILPGFRCDIGFLFRRKAT